MKIKNELVSIKIGDKQYDFNNLILDEYLNRFVKAQVDKDKLNSVSYDKRLDYCLLKFDTPFENLKEDTNLNNQDFDICFVGGSIIYNQTINENKITIGYTYDTSFNVWDYNKSTANDNYISNYYGKKVTAIGFNSYWVNDSNFLWKVPVCTVLDTSNYNIYLQENQELSITRKDIITTEALFYSNDKNKVPGPVHLVPYGVPQIIYQPNIYENSNSWKQFNDPGYGILYSIGLSSYIDYIDKEFVIGQDIQVEQNGTELNINGLENYLSTDSPLFPSNDIYPSSDLYPIESNYKYIIFKYKVWQMVHSGTYEETVSTPTDTGYYYYQAIPIDKFGKSNLKIKYERG